MLPPRTVQNVDVPGFFYGTAWKEDATESLTALALDAGFRAIDTANQRRHYFEAGVGAAIGAAIAAGSVRREDLFLQTKFTYVAGQDHRLPYDPAAAPAAQVEQSFASSLEHLGTTYVDSYVLHGPSTSRGLSSVDWEVWAAMEELQRAGKTRLVGVSNVSAAQLELLCERARVAPAFVQNRCYARTGWDRDTRRVAGAHGVLYQGFSLLTANGRELSTPTVKKIAQRAGKTLAQVAFRFAVQVGMVPLTGTTSPEHMREDLGIDGFLLDESEVSAIEKISG